MSSVFTVSFFGHRTLENPMIVEQRISDLVAHLIREKEYVEFLVGRNGDFDLLVASCVLRAKKELFSENSSLIWIQPYPNLSYLKNPEDFDKYYDEVEIFDSFSSLHPKSAFRQRNESMLDRSDYAVFWVENSFGGAYKALTYAKNNDIKHTNLAAECNDIL